ncbi:MAG TPA: diacylglycerol kinase family protein [Gammaproteobacteria bacterium]|nr:diacylglycerol kinase family protein [Gammaproteobacteria bacterium]
MTTALLINPISGRGKGRKLAESLQGHLKTSGVTCELHYTRAPREAIEIVRALAARHDRILIAGGDGTWCEAVNGAMAAAHRPVLGLIPIGTGNDFAKMLGYDNDWQAACKAIANGRTRLVDIGRCRYGLSREPVMGLSGQDAEGICRYFANGVGIGFDAEVSREAQRIRYLHGNAVYLLALARTLLLSYATPHVTIEHDRGTLQQTITLIAAANGRCYGGAFYIAPDARVDDGYLELVCARGLSRLRILGLLPKVLRGRHIDSPDVTTLRTRHMIVRSDVPLPVHLDGEVLTEEATHLEIDLLPRSLEVCA